MHIFPTAYFAPIAYYRAYVHAKEPVVETKEHFVKQTIRTRCELLGPNGKQLLSVPVERVNGNKTAVEDLKIVEDGWRKIHWKTIETAYSSSAYFDYYGMEVKELLEGNYVRLIDLNDAVVIQKKIVPTPVVKTVVKKVVSATVVQDSISEPKPEIEPETLNVP